MLMNKTLQSYNKMAGVYDEGTAEFWEQFPTTVIDAFAENLKGKKILDLGSGPGRDALLLKKRNLDVTCVDGSSSMCEMTKKLGFETIRADFRELSFPDESFDGVWAYTSLLHIPKEDMEEVLKKIHAILKSDGVFLVGMIQGEFEGDVRKEKWGDNLRYFKYYLPEELDTLVQSAGFQKVFSEKYRPHNNVYLNHIYVKI